MKEGKIDGRVVLKL